MSGVTDKTDAYFNDQRYSACGVLKPKIEINRMGWYQSGKFIWSHNCDFDYPNTVIKTEATEMTECGDLCLNNKLCTHLVYSSSGECKLMTGSAGKGNAIPSWSNICAIIEK